jgi:hypothetical protein
MLGRNRGDQRQIQPIEKFRVCLIFDGPFVCAQRLASTSVSRITGRVLLIF